MKKLIGLLFFLCANAQALEWNAKIFGGANFLQNSLVDGNETSYQAGYIVAGSLGVSCRCFRLEGEYAFRENHIDCTQFFTEGCSNLGYFQASSYMANVLYDLPLCTCLKAFVGIGAGKDFQQMHSSNSRIRFNQKWRPLSWQLMAGVAFPIYCNTDITVEYKFHQGGCHFNNHCIGIGLLYKFCFFR